MADRSAPPVLALAVATITAAVALRGSIPGAHRQPREPVPDNPASLIAVFALLAVAIGVMTLAVVLRARQRPVASAVVSSRPEWLRGDRGRLTWRGALIAFVVVLAWLGLSVWLSRLSGGAALDPSDSAPGGAEGSAPSQSATAPAGASEPLRPDTHLIGYVGAATAVFLLVLAAGTIVATRRRPRPAAPPHLEYVGAGAAVASGSETLARAAEVGLAEIADPNRDPRTAIIACYVAMEGELARLPEAAPQDFDTASEVLARAEAQHALRPGTATQLVDLFDEARFSRHVMTEDHRGAAATVLGEVLEEMRSRA